AAVADDLGGHALPHLAFRLRIDRQHEVGMGLDVDEAGGHGEPAGVDDLVGAAVERRPEGDDAAVRNGEIAAHARRAAAVDQGAAANEDIPGIRHQVSGIRRSELDTRYLIPDACHWLSLSGACNVTPPSTTSVCPVM